MFFGVVIFLNIVDMEFRLNSKSFLIIFLFFKSMWNVILMNIILKEIF